MLNELYLFLDQLGLNTAKIFGAAFVISFILVLAIREIFSWFMKTGTLAKQFSKISNCLEDIEGKIDQLSSNREFDSQDSPATSSPKKQFEINH